MLNISLKMLAISTEMQILLDIDRNKQQIVYHSYPFPFLLDSAYLLFERDHAAISHIVNQACPNLHCTTIWQWATYLFARFYDAGNDTFNKGEILANFGFLKELDISDIQDFTIVDLNTWSNLLYEGGCRGKNTIFRTYYDQFRREQIALFIASLGYHAIIRG